MKKLSGIFVLALLLVGSFAEAAQPPQPIHKLWAARPVVAPTDYVRRTTKYNQAQWGSRASTSLRLMPVYIHPYPNGKVGF